jgi:hypothetical protein
MSTDVTTTSQLVNPVTGEALTLASPTEDLGRWLADIRDFEYQLREAKRTVTTEILARLDKNAEWTAHLPGLKIRGDSPQPVEEWDGAQLREALLELVDEGVLAIEAVDAAVETIVSYKPRKAGINKLRKLGGRVAEVVDSLKRASEKDRRVTVSRA